MAAWLGSFRQDVVFGARLLRRSPIVSMAAVLSLALGVGATTGLFALVDAALLRPLPVDRPRDLAVLLWRMVDSPKVTTWGFWRVEATGARLSGSFSYQTVRQLERAADGVTRVGAFQILPTATIVASGESATAEAALVSGGFFETVGVRPARGRVLNSDDDRPEAPATAVISHRLWQRFFDGDQRVIGSVLAVNGRAFTIVGVAAAGFFGLQPGTWLDVYLPIETGLAVEPLFTRNKPTVNDRFWWLQAVARRSPGGDPRTLERMLGQAFARSVAPSLPSGLRRRPELVTRWGGDGYAFLNDDMATPAWILMGLVSLVLLISCANVANLLLAKAAARRPEAGMRLALGASRLRLVRQYLTEGVLIAALGGAVGFFVSRAFTSGLAGLVGVSLPGFALDVEANWRIVGIHVALAVAAGLLLGMVPAFALARTPMTVLGGRELRGDTRGRFRVGKVLVAAQIALSLFLLVMAGLFVRSLRNLYAVPLGFDAHDVVLFDVDPVRSGFSGAKRQELLERLLDTVRLVPGVKSATWSEFALATQTVNNHEIRVIGRPPQPGKYCDLLAVGPYFHDTLDIPLVLGRRIDERDTAAAPLVAVVNETFVREYLGGMAPLGQRFQVSDADDSRPTEIVGVVRDAKYAGLRPQGPEPVVYLPDLQHAASRSSVFEIRAAGSPRAIAGAVRAAVRSAFATVPVTNLRTYDDAIAEQLVGERVLSTLAMAFGLAALLLAAIGVYGVVAFVVARRTAEIGVRIALGATRGAVMRMVLNDNAAVVAPGAVLGLAASLASARFVRAQLYGLGPTDPLTIAASLTLIFAVSCAAAYFPARRAARVDPAEALRHE